MAEPFNGLKTVDGYWALYYVLLKKKGFDWSNPECRPRTVAELQHRCRMLFGSMADQRFAYMEGQKRTLSCVFGMSGFVPPSIVKFHKDYPGCMDYLLLEHYKGLALDTNLEDVRKMLIFENMGKHCNASINFINNGTAGFDKKALALIQKTSEKMANYASLAEARGWKDTILTVVKSNELLAKAQPPELLHPTNPDRPVTLKNWLQERRELVATLIFRENQTKDYQLMAGEAFSKQRVRQKSLKKEDEEEDEEEDKDEEDEEREEEEEPHTAAINSPPKEQRYNLGDREEYDRFFKKHYSAMPMDLNPTKIPMPKLLFLVNYLITSFAHKQTDFHTIATLLELNGKMSTVRTFFPTLKEDFIELKDKTIVVEVSNLMTKKNAA
jgi:hypothetical protein